MKGRSLKLNAILNVLRSIVAIIFPIITYPYAARVIGVDNIGRVNYVASLISYFMILTVFGIDTYGVRECAKVRDNSGDVSALASHLWSFELLAALVSLIGMGLVSVIYIPLHSYAPVILIQSLSVLFTAFGADWINVVFEDYAYITIRGIAINIINMAVLFIFVHKPEDYLVYAFLNISSSVFIGLFNFFYIRRFVRLRITRIPDIRGLVHVLMPFLVNDLSIAIYVGADVTILGIIKGDYYVGIYSAAVKIYTIVKTVFIAIFSVTLAQLSAHASAGKMDEFKKVVRGVVSVFALLAFPAATGLILYAEPIMLLIAGTEYIEGAMSLKLLAVALIFAAFGGIATRCVNIPLGYERVNTFATITAALSNTVLNIPMIMLFNDRGAAFATILAEAGVLVICIVNLIKQGYRIEAVIDLRNLRDVLVGVIAIVLVYVICITAFKSYAVRAVVGIVASVVLYFVVLFTLENGIVRDITDRIIKRRSISK